MDPISHNFLNYALIYIELRNYNDAMMIMMYEDEKIKLLIDNYKITKVCLLELAGERGTESHL